MFTKKDAFEKIKAGLGKESLISDRSIDEMLDTLMVSSKTEETTLEAFVENSMPLFNVFAGNLRKEVSVKFKEAKEKESEKKDPKEESKKDVEEEEENPLLKTISTILQKLESLEERQENDNVQRLAQSARKNAFSIAGKLYAENAINSAELDFDFSQEGAVDKFVEKVSKISSNFGFTPKNGKPNEREMFTELETEFKELDSQVENF